jgi:hypothetical protein
VIGVLTGEKVSQEDGRKMNFCFPGLKLESGPQLKENMKLWSTNPTYALNEFRIPMSLWLGMV